MTITMYDLAGAEMDRRFSPFCWRTGWRLPIRGWRSRLCLGGSSKRTSCRSRMRAGYRSSLMALGSSMIRRRSPITSRSAIPIVSR